MILIYDIQGFPSDLELTFEMFTKLYKEEKIILWDSANFNGDIVNEPKVIFSPDEEIIEFKILNVDNKEDAKAMNKLLNK